MSSRFLSQRVARYARSSIERSALARLRAARCRIGRHWSGGPPVTASIPWGTKWMVLVLSSIAVLLPYAIFLQRPTSAARSASTSAGREVAESVRFRHIDVGADRCPARPHRPLRLKRAEIDLGFSWNLVAALNQGLPGGHPL